MEMFEKALKEISKEYSVRRISQTYAQIDFDELFDPYNFIFIGILYEDNKVILTDFADYAQLCPWEDEDIPTLEKICQKYGVSFHNYHIECLYQNNEDIKNYYRCLLELREKFAKK